MFFERHPHAHPDADVFVPDSNQVGYQDQLRIFVELHLRDVIWHATHGSRMNRVGYDRVGVDDSFAAHSGPFAFEGITRWAHWLGKPSKLLARRAALHQQFSAIAAGPKFLRVEFGDWARKIRSRVH